MRALLIGNNGSIGKRHHENLKTLGVEVVGCELGEFPNYAVDFAVIASPTQTHRVWIENLSVYDVPFLCEKPVAGNSRDCQLLEGLKINVPNMVACNIRFSDSMAVAKAIIDQNEVVSFHARVSDANPQRAKYKEGIALQDIHEFDYLSYLFGGLDEIEVISNNDHKLYDAFIRTRSGVQGIVHGDCLSQRYHRELTLTTKRGTLTIPISVNNDMYLREMEYFIDCVKNKKQPMNSVKEAIELTQTICEEYEFA